MSLRPHPPTELAPETAARRSAGRRRQLLAACSGVAVVAVAVAAVLVGGGQDQRARDLPDRGAAAAATTASDSEQREADARASLNTLTAAWRGHDRERFVASAADTAAAARWAGATWNAMTALRVRRLDLRYVAGAVPPAGSPADGSAVVDVTWSQPGWQTPATTQLTLDLLDDDHAGGGADVGGEGGVLSLRARTGSPMPPWALHPSSVVRGNGATLVVLPAGGSARRAAGGSAAELRSMVSTARAQVDGVLSRSQQPSAGPLTVVAPGSTAAFGQVLGAPPADYEGIAAVTTTVDGSVRAAVAAQVVLNPAVFDVLGPVAAQVVLTHEATHATTGAAAVSMPLWVAEGFADYVALRDGAVPLRLAAAQALAAVRRSGPPSSLPGTADFAVGAHGLGRAYEEAWLAFRLLGRRHGNAATVAFYDAVLAGRAVGTALRTTTGSDLATVTARWRAELTRLARAHA